MSEQITPNPSVPTQVVQEMKFPRFINNLGIIPTSYKDSMSYYESLAWLCKFLEESVIPTLNENGEAVEELQGLYIELNSYVTHYFDTLDVQEEINNKLDDMVEAGTLQEIIADYLNSKAVFGFDTVAEMKSATNLINGSYARTLGFYAKNDGGGCLYKIRTLTNDDVVDNIFIHEMNDNELIAETIINDIFIPECLGAKNDGSTDCSSIFNSIFSKMRDNDKLIMSGTYLINQPLYLPNYNNIIISGGTLKANNFNGYILNSNTNSRTGYSGWSYATENLTIENVFFDGNYKANGLYLNRYLRVKIISCTFHNFKEYGIYTEDGHEAQIIGTNLIGKTNGDESIANTGICLNSHDNIIDSCVIAYCQWAIDIQQSTQQISNSHFYCGELNGGNVKVSKTSYISFDNNYFDGSGIYAINPWFLTIANNIFLITSNTHHIIKFEKDSDTNPYVHSIYIQNSQVVDYRTTQTDIEFVECNFNPFSIENCVIKNIELPSHVLLTNPYSIFSFDNANLPVIVPNSFFRANNTSNTIGTHYEIDTWYEAEASGNLIKSNYIGNTSQYPWLFFEIYVPERMRIRRNFLTSETSSTMAFFQSDETFIGNNIVTLPKGKYIVGVFRTVEMTLEI